MKYAIRTVLAVTAITAAACSFSGKAEKPEEPETISYEQQAEEVYNTMPAEERVKGDAEIGGCQ